MMKKLFFLFLLLIGVPSYSQMVDLMGSLSVQGALTTGDTHAVHQGLSVLKQNQILQDLTQAAMEIKTQFMGNYDSVSQYSVSGNYFNGLDWDISSLSSNLFYIQLNQIDKTTCSKLLSSRVPTIYTELNGQRNSKECSDNNQIRFVFD